MSDNKTQTIEVNLNNDGSSKSTSISNAINVNTYIGILTGITAANVFASLNTFIVSELQKDIWVIGIFMGIAVPVLTVAITHHIHEVGPKPYNSPVADFTTHTILNLVLSLLARVFICESHYSTAEDAFINSSTAELIIESNICIFICIYVAILLLGIFTIRVGRISKHSSGVKHSRALYLALVSTGALLVIFDCPIALAILGYIIALFSFAFMIFRTKRLSI